MDSLEEMRWAILGCFQEQDYFDASVPWRPPEPGRQSRRSRWPAPGLTNAWLAGAAASGLWTGRPFAQSRPSEVLQEKLL
jgi:hypothetical protein